VRIRVLGRTEIAADDGEFRVVAGRRSQQLLALYALYLGRPVDDHRAFEALWGEAPPDGASGSLRTYVTRLRKAVGDDLVVRAAGGYSLALDPADLDVSVFEQRVAAGRAAARSSNPVRSLKELRAALELWRGPPWATLAGWGPADADAVRCEELHASAEEQAAECSIRVDDLAGAVEQLLVLCEREPYRERRWELLMVALYLSGRQADALRAYQRARDLLVDELGIEPSARLRQLERDVLHQRLGAEWFDGRSEPSAGTGVDPGASARAGPARVAPPPGTRAADVVGRDEEMQALLAELERALAGQPRVVAVSGEAGIGKSRLLAALRDEAAARGAGVHGGESYEAEATGAYRPIAALIRSLARDAGSQGAAALAAETHELAILLPELDTSRAFAPSEKVVGDRQLRLFDSVTRLVQGMAADGPLVITLDDVHWADPESLALLAHVLRHAGPVPLVVVLAYRPEEVGTNHPLPMLLTQLRRTRPVLVLELSGLAVEPLAQLISAVTGTEATPAVVEAVAGSSGGNPLFVAEVAKTLDPTSATWSLDQLRRRLPARIDDVLSRRIALVGEESREALSVLSASPGGCDMATLAATLDVDPVAAIGIAEELLTAGLVVERDVDGTVGYTPAHALYAFAAFGTSSRARQVSIHHRLALALEADVEADPEAHLAAAAYHWHAAGRSGDPRKAKQRCEQAGDLAVERTAFAEAVAHYGRALDAVAWTGGDDAVRGVLLTKRAMAHDRTGDPVARQQDAEEAAELAAAVGDTHTLARAALVQGGFRSTYGLPNPATTSLLARAYDLVDPDSSCDRALLCARLAQERFHEGDYVEARRLSAEGVELARAVGDDAVVLAAFHGRVWTLNHPDWLEERAALADEMVERAIRTRNREWEMAGRVWRAAALLERGEVGAVDVELGALDRLVPVVKVPIEQVRVATLRTTRAMMRGDFDTGLVLAQEAHAIGSSIEPANADQVLHAQMIAPLRERAQLAAVLPMVEHLAAQYTEAPGWRCAAAFVFCEVGLPDRARELVAPLLAQLGLVPRDLAWMQALAFLAEVVAATGGGDDAVALYEQLVPFDGRNVGLWDIASSGAVAHYLGILAARFGDAGRAERHLRDAVAFNDRTGQEPAELWSRTRLAELLAASGRQGEAVELAVDVVSRASSRGWPAVEAVAGKVVSDT
jgi:DNA-binding SARP family transcriptional activator